MNRPTIKVWETTFPLDCAGSEQKKQMVHVKMNIIANTTVRGGEMVLKIDDKMNTVNGTKRERGNENKKK